MYWSTSDNTRIRSSFHSLSSAKARLNSTDSKTKSAEGSSVCMIDPSDSQGGNRNFTHTKQQISSCTFCIVAFILTGGWSHSPQKPLQTSRDQELLEILARTTDTSNLQFLTERNAQINDLRRQYFEKFLRPDWVTEFSVVNTSGLTPNSDTFSGLQANFRSAMQFKGDWQLNSEWSLLTLQKGLPPTQITSDSDLPTLELLEMSYGKMRSIELGLGLPEDHSLLHHSKARSIFSGLSIKLHPLEQKLTPTSPHYSFEFQHGWVNLLSPIEVGPGRTKLQRTRPRFRFQWSPGQTAFAIASALEWYSDSDGALGRIIGRRPNALAEIENSSESRWRLFHFDAQAQYLPNDDNSLTFSFQRVSNTLGMTSTPAWSLATRFEKIFSWSLGVLRPALGFNAFQIPAGSVPPLRLPLEFTPGTQGTLAQLEFTLNPYPFLNSEFQLGAHVLSEQKLEGTRNLRCSLWTGNSAQTCSVGWITLAWSLKLPTNL